MQISDKKRLNARIRSNQKRVMYQEWRNLLFLHWAYDPNEIQKTLPNGLYVDIYNHNCYVTITPFIIQNLKIANLSSFPIFSNFYEINVRTYVVDEKGNPGIWFYSLDINSSFAVLFSRILASLPYYRADLKFSKKNDFYKFEGLRKLISFNFTCRPEKDSYQAKIGSLDFFLIERYSLFTFDRKNLNIGKVHHQPYPLFKIENIQYNEKGLFESNFLENPKRKAAFSHFSSGVNVEIFPIKKI